MTPVIDCHAHIVPPEMWRAMQHEGARYGVEIGGDDARRMIRLAGSDYTRPMYMPLTATDARLATMDRQGIDMQVLSGYVDFTGYTMPLDLAVRFSELQNACIAGVVAENPRRYAGAANVPLQDTTSAIRVMERARAATTAFTPCRSRPISAAEGFSTIRRSTRSGRPPRRWRC